MVGVGTGRRMTGREGGRPAPTMGGEPSPRVQRLRCPITSSAVGEGSMEDQAKCPNCGSELLYKSGAVASGTVWSPNLLPGLGGLMRFADIYVVACADCGLLQFFAAATARDKLPGRWRRLL